MPSAISRLCLRPGRRAPRHAALRRRRPAAVLRERPALPQAVQLMPVGTASCNFQKPGCAASSTPPLDTPQLADALTMAGLEVEAVDAGGARLHHFVVGQDPSAEKHPDADRLRVCQVDVGDGSAAPPSCAARPTPRRAQACPCARPAPICPASTIKVAKVRGVESYGMLCSAQGARSGRRGGWPDRAGCGRAGRHGFPRLARPRRHADHAQAHAQPRGLPVDARASRAKSARSPARRCKAAAVHEAPVRMQGHATGRGHGQRGVPALSRARRARHQRAGRHAALDGRAAGAQRHPPAAGAGRHHQLRAARARPADARLRPVAPQRRHRGAAGARGRNTRTAERPDRRTRPRHAA